MTVVRRFLDWLEDKFLLRANRIPALDGIRGWSIIMVFGVHFFARYQPKFYFTEPGGAAWAFLTVAHAGSFGVDLFFFLSGLLVYKSIMNKKPGALRFFYDRYRRLLPVIVFVTIYVAADTEWTKLFDNLFFLSIFNSPLIHFFTWPLVYEMYFYVLCAVLFIGCRRIAFTRSWPFFFLLVAALVFCEFEVNFRISFARFLGFFYGVALARLMADARLLAYLKRLPRLTWLVGLILFLYCRWLWGTGYFMAAHGNEHIKNLLFFSAVNGSLFLITASVLTRPSLLSRVFCFLPLRFIGIISYSLFMTHVLTMQIAQNVLRISTTGVWSMLANYVTTLACALGLAAFSFYYLERPYFVRHPLPTRPRCGEGATTGATSL
ncbi:acyltransferase [Solidesulfovibrio sp.]|uniref:acyltransferase family protein n=1 Tax=Solidesulfovibrio sp. TaxID=2910990 RepID=UPI002B218CAA|nr:acyltransferase [Solidesulfovibrio sp.]MEA5089138.1 acyltransferase [Solidesulfovibrio sp.]